MADRDLIPVSWNSHNINDSNFSSGFTPGIEWGLPQVKIDQVDRLQKWPLIASVSRPGRSLTLTVWIINSDVRTYRDYLLHWFSPEDEDPKLLVVEDEDGTGDRYVQGICSAITPLVIGGRACNDAFTVNITVHGDVRWRKVTETSSTLNITASGESNNITNAGSDDAYPKITITPNAAKTGPTNLLSIFAAIRWRAVEGYTNYPLDIVNNVWNTAILIQTATATTTDGAINAVVTTITLDSTAGFGTSGMAYITDPVTNDEQISYTGVSGNDLTGCVRGIGGTSAAAHSGLQAIKVSTMLANGADIVVTVDGSKVDYWLQDLDTVTTQVWANINWDKAWAGILAEAFTNVQSISTITVNESIKKAPDAGILVVGTEAFTYTSKNNSDKKFSGITRAALTTSADTHAIGDVIWWCQHDIQLKYGDEGATARVMDDDYKPVMDLDSTNIIWTYTILGADNGLRAGQWQQATSWGSPTYSGGTEESEADPWTAPGLSCAKEKGRYKLYNPCYITSANFSSAQNYSTTRANFWGYVSQWTGKYWKGTYNIPDPAGDSAWGAWNQDVSFDSSRKIISYMCGSSYSSTTNQLEVNTVAVTLNNSYTPVVTLYGGGGNTTYQIEGTLYNQNTSIYLGITFQITIGQSLEIDTDLKTVTSLEDDSGQFQAITLTGGARRDWFKLAPGVNTIVYTDSGTSDVDLIIAYEERNY